MPIQTETWPAEWATSIPEDQWQLYQTVIYRVRDTSIPFALGGAFGLAAYTNHLRNTKDLDIYVLPRDRDTAVDALTRAGLADYYEREPYDRRWIYRGYTGNAIVDIIFAMANQRDFVDEHWLSAAVPVTCLGEELLVIAPEEMMWQKLYVLQRDRCDWPDVLNLLGALADKLDWPHLLDRLGPDRPLLGGVLSVFKWICPGRARSIPDWVWRRVGVALPEGSTERNCRHLDLLDTRDWFHV